MAARLAAALLIIAGCSRPAPTSGARIDAVTRNAPAAIAGLQPGDVVVSSNKGLVRDPFDLLDLELFEVPRAPVMLDVLRGPRRLAIKLPIGEWKVTSRPVLSGELEALDVEAHRLAAESKWAEAATRWEPLAAGLTADARARDACWALVQLGISQSRAKQVDASERAFEQARGSARALKDPALEGNILSLLAEERGNRGDRTGLVQAYEAALEARRPIDPDGLARSAVLVRLSALRRMHGELGPAEAAAREALELRERLAPGSVELATALTALGSVFFERGDERAAEPLDKRALALRESLAPLGADLMSVLANAGLLAKNKGDLSTAEELFHRSLALQEKADPTAYEAAFPLNFLGNLARIKGEPAQAEAYYRRSLAIFQKHRPDGVAVAGCLNNLGNNAERQGDFAGAEAFHRQALAMREKMTPGTLDVAASYNSLGTIAMDRGDLAAAQPLLERALELKQKIAPGTVIVSSTLYALGDLAVAQHDYPRALEAHLKALQIRALLAPGTANHALSLQAVGKVQRLLGNRAAALESWAAAIDAVEAQRGRLRDSEDARSGFASTFAELYRDQIDLLVEAGRGDDAFKLLERSRAQGFLNMLAQRQLGLGAETPAELLASQRQLDTEYDQAQAALGKLSPAKDAAEVQRRVNALAELAQRRDKVAANIRKAAPAVAALSAPQSVDVAAAQAALDPGTVLLSYSVGKDRTLLFAVTAEDGLRIFPIAMTAEALRARVLAFRGMIERGRRLDEPEPPLLAQGERLFADLLGPALPILEAHARIVISADGPLHVLPMAALVRSRAPLEYLAEWRPTHAIASATVYAKLRSGKRPDDGAPLVAFGDPAYEGRFPQLPNSRDEVTQLAALLGPKSQVFLGAAATEAQAVSGTAGARYVHFATHGLLDRRLPLDSALVLTASKDDNGLLQAWEIIERLRLNADLVTLSSCETGLGRELGGEGVISLSRAFQYAGARSVVVSLWSVADRSTAELMLAFYTQLKEGQTKDAALASAQRALIHSERSKHPFHWAAFELTGDWQ